MALEAADLKNPEKMLEFLNGLEVRLTTMSQPPSSDKPEHPQGFCETADACPQCQPYVAQAQVHYAEAHNKGATAGRNNILNKLAQASQDLDMVPAAQVLGARVAQIEAGEGDVHAQVLIIKSANGELVGVSA